MREQASAGELEQHELECSPEEKAADIPYINEYCTTRHRGVVKCEWTIEKGRILRSNQAFKQGDIIFQEPPLHIVAEQKGNSAFDRLQELCESDAETFDYDPLWYWTALCSLKHEQLPASENRLQEISEDQQRKLLLLYHSEITEASEASICLVKELGLGDTLDPLHLEQLLQVWILNCFEHSDSPLGYSTYFMSSFMSHSCSPNAVWHYDGDDFVLRARRDIAVHDEISVSYLSEDSLLESIPVRRKHLKDSKHFFCECSRCSGKRDQSRGFRCPVSTCGATLFVGSCGDSVALSKQLKILVGIECSSCGHCVQDDEAVQMLQEEQWLENTLEQLERRLEKSGMIKLVGPMEEACERGEKSLAQHWLLDKCWHLLSDMYNNGNRQKDAEELMRKRITFQEGAFPGLSGTHAWTLETYADMLLKHHGVTIDPQIAIPNEATAKRIKLLVPPVFEDALGILRLMFGDKHEYYTSVERKQQELALELRRLLLPGGPHVRGTGV